MKRKTPPLVTIDLTRPVPDSPGVFALYTLWGYHNQANGNLVSIGEPCAESRAAIIKDRLRLVREQRP